MISIDEKATPETAVEVYAALVRVVRDLNQELGRINSSHESSNGSVIVSSRLPDPGRSYLGKMVQVRDGSTFPTPAYVCIETSAGVYEWKTYTLA